MYEQMNKQILWNDPYFQDKAFNHKNKEDCHKEYVSLHLVQWVRRNRSGRTNTQTEGQTSKRTN